MVIPSEIGNNFGNRWTVQLEIVGYVRGNSARAKNSQYFTK